MTEQQRQPEGRGPVHRNTGDLLAQLYGQLAHPMRKVCYEPLADHYHRKYRSKFPKHHSKVLILDLALLFIAGGLVVFWIFANAILPLFPVPALVSIEMLAPKSIVSGELADFVVSYRNDSPQELACAELRITLPDDTVLEHEALAMEGSQKTCYVERGEMAMFMDPAEPDVHVILLGTIEPGGNDAVRFKARTYGGTGSVKTMTAELRYWELGATEPSRVSGRNEWQVTGSALALDVTAPDVASRGQLRTVKVTYANRGADRLEDAILRLSVPEDFTVTGSVPAAATRGEWRLGSLDAGEEGTIQVFGRFNPAESDVAPTFAVRGYVQAGGRLRLAELVRKNADPGAADVHLTTELLSPAGRAALVPGEPVQVRIAYRNDSDHDLNDVRVALDPGAAWLENVAPATLSWDPSTTPSLAAVKPGDAGELIASFSVPAVIPAEAGRPALHLVTGAHYAVDGEPGHEVRIDTPSIDLPIATRLTVSGTALYFTKDGDQLGIGPLPPKVNETTKYRVFLSIATTTGAASDVVVEATLASNVAWTGKASVTAGESLDHFPSTGRVRWMLGRVPEGTGEEIKFGATFEVALTPGADAAGSAPLLLQNIKITGRDEGTGLTLHGAAENITTDLPYDVRAAGKGTVTE